MTTANDSVPVTLGPVQGPLLLQGRAVVTKGGRRDLLRGTEPVETIRRRTQLGDAS